MGGHIPMKEDPPSLDEIVARYGDPADKMAEAYFDCLARAEACEAGSDPDEAQDLRELAETCRRSLAQYGFVPEREGDVSKAVRPK